MNRTGVTCLLAIVPAAGLAAAESWPGQATCVPHDHGCAIQWEFARSPRSFYQLEFLDERSLKWKKLAKPYSAFHKRSKAVPGARLYRVRGCDDEMMQQNCASSTVQWAVSRPAPEAMPSYLIDGTGLAMQITKSAPYDVQLAQYNVYRLIQLLDRVPNIAKLPPMTKPSESLAPTGATDANEEILTGIYANYSQRRRQASGN